MKDTTLLQKIGVLNDTININDTIISQVGKVPLQFNDNLKEYFECLDDENSFGYGAAKTVAIFASDAAMYWNNTINNNVYINKPVVIQTFAKYIGEERAEQLLDLIRLSASSSIFSASVIPYKAVLYGKRIATLVDIVGFMLIAIILMTPKEFIDSWEINYGKGLLQIVKDSIMIDTDVTAEEIIPAGRLNFLSMEEKKNIIGSFWNCIIDTIEHLYANKMKGGEEDE